MPSIFTFRFFNILLKMRNSHAAIAGPLEVLLLRAPSRLATLLESLPFFASKLALVLPSQISSNGLRYRILSFGKFVDGRGRCLRTL